MIGSLGANLPPFTWQSFLDIIVVTVVIYHLLNMVRGTRAAQMLIGVTGIAVLLVLIRRGSLPVLNWAITNMLPYATFALIVVFAPEIRQALAKAGRLLTFSSARDGESEVYDDLVLAASFLCQHKIGALIVIEREIGLRTFVESGVPLDALVTYDLLATIFLPDTPLHDGAIIIQQDRVAAAACFLPLSMNPVLSNQVGTRHRAAIGITEETDAVAIIISEETGQISLAQAGALERGLTVEELRLRLSALLRQFVPQVALPTSLKSHDPEHALGGSREVGR